MGETLTLKLDYLSKDGKRSTKDFTIKISNLKENSDKYFGRTDIKWEMFFTLVIPDHYYDTLVNKVVPNKNGSTSYSYLHFKKTLRSETIKGLCDKYVDILNDCDWIFSIDKRELKKVIYYTVGSKYRKSQSIWDGTKIGDKFNMDVEVAVGYVDKNDIRYNDEKIQHSKNKHTDDIYRMKYVEYTDERMKFFETMDYDIDSVLRNPSVVPSKLFSGEDIMLIVMKGYGKNDINGKEIFEGDIIELTNASGITLRVICRFGDVKRNLSLNDSINYCEITGFYFEYDGNVKTFPIVNNYAGKHDVEMFKIIGNIYENTYEKYE